MHSVIYCVEILATKAFLYDSIISRCNNSPSLDALRLTAAHIEVAVSQPVVLFSIAVSFILVHGCVYIPNVIIRYVIVPGIEDNNRTTHSDWRT